MTPIYFAAEAIRRRLAAIAHAADDNRIDDYVACFTPDAVWEIPSGTYSGRDEIRTVLEAIAPRQPQRHVVTNSAIEVKDQRAIAISDFVFLVYGDSGWSVAAIGRYHDVFHEAGGGDWRLGHRAVRDQTPDGYMPSTP
ncbi:nuclear transport factor 2 family protein [Rhodococcus sp. NPDC057529]|uniref:nuclear transport factor 2 family protein n=1 Tax=Rhodococcus sp. NPDC057529 TaxID=3346158 RepID=UPI00366F2C1A